MRGLADRLLGAGQAGAGAHRPAHPRAGVGRRRPDAFGQPAEHDHLGRLQPGFQQAPDEHARVLAAVAAPQRPAAAHHRAFQQRVQQAGQHRAAAGRAGAAAPASGAASRHGQRLALLLRPEARGAGRGVGGGERLGRLRSARPAARRRAMRRRPGRAAAAPGRLPAASAGRAAPSAPVRRARAGRRGRAAAAGRAAPRVPARAPPRGRRPADSPAAASGCFSSASSGTGASRAATAAASRRRNTAGGVSASVSPALSSATTPQRSSSAATRPASARSGVTSAARRPAAPARRAGSARWRPLPPARRRRPGGIGRRCCAAPGARQAASAAAGSSAWRSEATRAGRRQRTCRPSSATSPRVAPSPASRCRSPACGCVVVQRVPGRRVRSRSSPGSTTGPCGRRATTPQQRARRRGCRRWCRRPRPARPAGMPPRPRLRPQQRHLPRRRVHQPVGGQPAGPGLGDDRQEPQRGLPVLGMRGVGGPRQRRRGGEFRPARPRPSGLRVRAPAARRDRPGRRRRGPPAVSAPARPARPAAPAHRPPAAGRARRTAPAAPRPARPGRRCAAAACGRPLPARRKASASARAARRVGSRIRPRASAIGAVRGQPAPRQRVEERHVRWNGRQLHRLSPVSLGGQRRLAPPRGRRGWTGETTARHAPRRRAGRRRWRGPRRGSWRTSPPAGRRTARGVTSWTPA